MQEIKAPLTNVQMEYLKLLSLNLKEEDLEALRVLILKFLNEKMQQEIEVVWKEKGYSNETIKGWLNED